MRQGRGSNGPAGLPGKVRWPTLCVAVLVAVTSVLEVGDRLALAAEPETRPATIEVSLREGMLSVSLREAPLAEALRAIGERAGFRVVIKGDLDTPVTWSFAEVGLEKALRRLLRNKNSVMRYASRRDGGTEHLVEVIAWPGNGEAAASTAGVVTTIRSGKIEAAGRPPLGGPDADAARIEGSSDYASPRVDSETDGPRKSSGPRRALVRVGILRPIGRGPERLLELAHVQRGTRSVNTVVRYDRRHFVGGLGGAQPL